MLQGLRCEEPRTAPWADVIASRAFHSNSSKLTVRMPAAATVLSHAGRRVTDGYSSREVQSTVRKLTR